MHAPIPSDLLIPCGNATSKTKTESHANVVYANVDACCIGDNHIPLLDEQHISVNAPDVLCVGELPDDLFSDFDLSGIDAIEYDDLNIYDTQQAHFELHDPYMDILSKKASNPHQPPNTLFPHSKISDSLIDTDSKDCVKEHRSDAAIVCSIDHDGLEFAGIPVVSDNRVMEWMKINRKCRNVQTVVSNVKDIVWESPTSPQKNEFGFYECCLCIPDTSNILVDCSNPKQMCLCVCHDVIKTRIAEIMRERGISVDHGVHEPEHTTDHVYYKEVDTSSNIGSATPIGQEHALYEMNDTAPKPSRRKRSKRKPYKCSNCNSTQHTRATCTYKCKTCGKSGHTPKECPNHKAVSHRKRL